jgi:hypothetical protein
VPQIVEPPKKTAVRAASTPSGCQVRRMPCSSMLMVWLANAGRRQP